MRLPLLLCAAATLAVSASAQDRPAPNPRATRSVVYGRNGMIATSQPLASAAGLKVLQDGGNAIDAAVTAAMVLSVVEPTMNGPGGDLFAIVYSAKDHKLYGLNASGRASAAATPEEFARRGLKDIPYRGELSVSVPGVVNGWATLLERFGKMPFGKALQPAIGYARDGYGVSEVIAYQWAEEEATLARDPNAASVFLPDGHAPKPGDVFRNPKLAATYGTLARDGASAFYRGAIAQQIAADMKRRKGLITESDLAAHHSDWFDPISTDYRGYQVFELPPNTQGITALEMLNILEGFDLKALGHNTAAYLHVFTEAKRIAFADRDAYLADAESVPPGVLKMLLSKAYAERRRKEIDLNHAARSWEAGIFPASDEQVDARESHRSRRRVGYVDRAGGTDDVHERRPAKTPDALRRSRALQRAAAAGAFSQAGLIVQRQFGPPAKMLQRPASAHRAHASSGAQGNGDTPPRGDTVYLTAADRDGNVISLIQSLYEAFGAGIVAGDTGIVLQNRGSLFTLMPGHPDRIAPGKRPMHTLVPAMVFKDGKPWLSFGVMGGDMQPQGHVQVLANLIDFGMNVQEAGEAPRVRHMGNSLALESGIGSEAQFGLAQRGHNLITRIGAFGGFQGILIDSRTGLLMGASDPRKDGLAIGY